MSKSKEPVENVAQQGKSPPPEGAANTEGGNSKSQSGATEVNLKGDDAADQEIAPAAETIGESEPQAGMPGPIDKSAAAAAVDQVFAEAYPSDDADSPESADERAEPEKAEELPTVEAEETPLANAEVNVDEGAAAIVAATEQPVDVAPNQGPSLAEAAPTSSEVDTQIEKEVDTQVEKEADAQVEPEAETEAQPGPAELEPTSPQDTAEQEAEPVSESAPAQIDAQALLAALEEQRTAFVAAAFGDAPPRRDFLQQKLDGFVESLQGALEANAATVADEAGRLTEQLRALHDDSLAQEREQSSAVAERVDQQAAVYDTLFGQIAVLAESVSGELERLNEEDDQFKSAPEALRMELQNYKKGISIIHRMLSRLRDGKKVFEDSPQGELIEDFAPGEAPSTLDQFSQYNVNLCDSFHQIREGNYNAHRDTETILDERQKAAKNAVKELVRAFDGIDNGLEHEGESRERLTQEEESCRELIAAWLTSYETLKQHAEEFLEKTGIKAYSVEPGTHFDPETMEPEATVVDPGAEDETVARVTRRGFSLDGVTVRPMCVEVVKNP